MPDQWRLDVASKRPMGLWDGEAQRVHSVLTAISTAFQQQYGKEIGWTNEDLDFAQWQDTEAIADELIKKRLRDDAGALMEGASARTLAHGFLGTQRTSHPTVLARISAGAHRWPFNLILEVEADDPESDARTLHDHPAEWLADLLSTTAAAAHADQGRISTFQLSRLVHRARENAMVSALTLLPHGAGRASLPDDVTAYPCTSGYPGATIVAVTDLTRVETDPGSLIAPLLKLDDILKTVIP